MAGRTQTHPSLLCTVLPKLRRSIASLSRAAAELAHYALPNIEKENILEEGLQRRDGELDPLHSVPDRIAFALAIDVFEETILFPAEKA